MKTWFVSKLLLLYVICLCFPFADASCKPSNIAFEKIIGQVLKQTEIAQSLKLPVKYDNSDSSNSIDDCAEVCRANIDCTAFYVDIINSMCHVSNLSISANIFYAKNVPQSIKSHQFYFRKICMKGPKCKRTWSFIVHPGIVLQQPTYTERTIKDVTNREECQQYCYIETAYNCRSAIYYPQTRNCVLNSNSMVTKPNNYILSVNSRNDDVVPVYMENTCVTVPKKCDFALAYIKDSFYVDKIFWDVDKAKCGHLCLNEDDFLCTGYQFDSKERRCDLTSAHFGQTDMASIQTTDAINAIFYRNKCSNVVMKCDARSMTAVVKIEPNFKGRVYAMPDPNGCFSAPAYKSQDEIFLKMPLRGHKCKTKHLGNGTFGNSIIIQEHPYILKQTDKRVDVYCDYDIITQKLRSGKHVMDDNDITEVQSTVTGVVHTPRIRLQIVDENGSEVVTGVTLGQKLTLNVEILDKSVYGIFGRSLVAKSGDQEDEIPLIDENGCPIEPSVFPPLRVIDDNKEASHRTLTSSFEAFKFAANPLVRFELTISFCLDRCKPVECNNEVADELSYNSYGKRRKRSLNEDFVTDVTMHKTLLVIPSAIVANTSTPAPTDDPIQTSKGDKVPHSVSGLCLTKPVMYTLISMAAILQIFTLISCFLCIARSRRSSDSQSQRFISPPSFKNDSLSSRVRFFQSPSKYYSRS